MARAINLVAYYEFGGIQFWSVSKNAGECYFMLGLAI